MMQYFTTVRALNYVNSRFNVLSQNTYTYIDMNIIIIKTEAI